MTTVTEAAPLDIDEYEKWLKREREVRSLRKAKSQYDAAALSIKTEFEQSGIWQGLISGLREYNGEYEVLHSGYGLVPNPDDPPKLEIKPFKSLLAKSFRKNILQNPNWPEPPDFGWILPGSWYSQIDDIVRTSFVVKYLDGVIFLSEKVNELCTMHGLQVRSDLEAKEKGYYAAHSYLASEFSIPGPSWEPQTIETEIEIQIRTQVQDLLRSLLHRYYEQHRVSPIQQDDIWQWNYRSDEFVTSYLGHIIHFVEGMIVEIRDK